MEALRDISTLRTACEHGLLRKTLRGVGIQSVIFGVLALVPGIAATPMNAIAKCQVAIGLLLVVEGALMLLSPRPSGLILEGLSFLMVGVCNFLLSAIVDSGLFAGLAVVQFICGVRSLRRYPRFSIIGSGEPPQASLKWVGETATSVIQLGSSESTDIVELQPPMRWKAKLFQNAALFVSPGGREVLLLGSKDIHLEEGAYNGRTISVSLRLGSRVIKSAMTPRCHARLAGWLSQSQ